MATKKPTKKKITVAKVKVRELRTPKPVTVSRTRGVGGGGNVDLPPM